MGRLNSQKSQSLFIRFYSPEPVKRALQFNGISKWGSSLFIRPAYVPESSLEKPPLENENCNSDVTSKLIQKEAEVVKLKAIVERQKIRIENVEKERDEALKEKEDIL